MSKVDIGPLPELSELEHFSPATETPAPAPDGSLLRGFVWASAAGMVFWLALARLVLH